jgi:hypothetical protein
MKSIAVFLLITLAAIAFARAATKPVRVFSLAGQSNMEGAGQIKAGPEQSLQQTGLALELGRQDLLLIGEAMNVKDFEGLCFRKVMNPLEKQKTA